jgi:hypothetical protein
MRTLQDSALFDFDDCWGAQPSNAQQSTDLLPSDFDIVAAMGDDHH